MSLSGKSRSSIAAGRSFSIDNVPYKTSRISSTEFHYIFEVNPGEDHDPQEVHLGKLKRFSLHELQVATNNFSNRNVIGSSRFSKVYRGRLADGSLVAVKRMREGCELAFQNIVRVNNVAVHRNLLPLRGLCMTPMERMLVYPYMVNGTVVFRLRERPETQPPLDWPTRKRIALGSARGLAYLNEECDPRIIHRDIKASNILLDDEFEAVVGVFGLAKLLDDEETHVTTAVRGTSGHIAPEYLSTGKCSEKTDVFGYGIMLLELITGQGAFDFEEVALLDWVKGCLEEKKLETPVDANLQGNYVENEVEQLIQIALLCTQNSPTKRPKMSEVVKMLEGDSLAERWQEWLTEEVFQLEFNHKHNPNTDWIVGDSTSDIQPDELSGPR
ncbi:hypothetical protein ACH5RR_016446 [Cinchona calisaya]|uniref:non-specific serine/threonine protein kinase n=1 Tax=Cinchona calisaya TaxID=153742 RepID=A0ABD2ZYN4_9GENT